MFNRFVINVGLLGILSLLMAQCGFPGRELTAGERKADLKWAFTVFERNYAPKEWKKKNLKIDMAKEQATCLKAANKKQTNEQFRALFQRCIHMVKDAHVSAMQQGSLLPEDSHFAALGFVAARTKFADASGKTLNGLRIHRFLKGYESLAALMAPGDIITKIDGKTVKEVLMAQIIPYIDAGQEETNLTMASMMYAARSSLQLPMPTEKAVQLTLSNMFGQEYEVSLPWVIEDELSFNEKQAPPKKEESKPQEEAQPSALADLFKGAQFFADQLNRITDLISNTGRRGTAILENTFRYTKVNPTLKRILEGNDEARNPAFDVLTSIANKDKTVLDALVKLNVNTKSLVQATIIDALPTTGQIPAKLVIEKDGSRYGYMKIGGFPGEDKFMAEYAAIIAKFNQEGIEGLIIDLLDNGGGSLTHGMRMANALTSQPLRMPSMQVALNDNWINSFRSQKAFGTGTDQKIATNIVAMLREDVKKGQRISRKIGLDALDITLKANKLNCDVLGTCLPKGIKMAVMINETCVSMCDIFASVIRDNKLGILVGQQTMGGGGNVTQHVFSPISKFIVSTTESLIVDANGKYLENNGVKADEPIDMVMDRERGFQEAISKAFEVISKPVAPLPTPPTP